MSTDLDKDGAAPDASRDDEWRLDAARFKYVFDVYRKIYPLDSAADPINLLMDMQHWCRLNRVSFQREVAEATELFMDECQAEGLKFRLTAAEAGQLIGGRTDDWWDRELAYLDEREKRIAQVDKDLESFMTHRRTQAQEAEKPC